MVLAVDDTDTADGNICVVTGSKDHYIKVSITVDVNSASKAPTLTTEFEALRLSFITHVISPIPSKG